MTRPLRRLMVLGYVAVTVAAACWLVAQGRLATYVCAASLVGLVLALRAVAPGRHLMYAAGVVVGLATLGVAAWPSDPGGGYCGSVLNPGQAEGAYDSGDDPYGYFQACDRRAAVYGALTLAGATGAGLLLGLSFRQRGGVETSAAPSLPAATSSPSR